MSLSSRSTFALGTIAATAIAAGWRCWKTPFYPVGIGFNLVSPDGRFHAFATTFYDVSFFGRRSAFYRFEVEDKTTSQTVGCHQTERIAETAAHNLGAEAKIEWASDSRSLRVIVKSELLWEYEIHAA
ncbi:MAG TPA: hypothetical protein VH518_19020 [Tepidisphaeraceae bacterium]